MTVTSENTRWIASSAWAVADQAIYVGSTALLNIFLARWLSAADYGAFAVAYSVFLLFGAFYVALLIEPMLVFGPGRYARQFSGYLALLVRGSQLFTLAGSLLLVVAGLACWFLGSPVLEHALLGLAVAAPGTLFMWLVKRAAYVRHRPRLAVAQSSIYFVLLLSGMLLLKSVHAVSVFSTMLVMALAGTCSALWLTRRLRSLTRDVQRPPDRGGVLLTHWGYGRWAVLTGLLAWVPLNFFFVALSTSIGLEASGNLKAVTNLVLPALQANAALSLVLLPMLVTHTRETVKFRRLIGRALLSFAVVGVAYALVIGVFGRFLMGALYGGRYHASASVMWLLALIPILDGAQAVLGSALRSLQRPKQIFRAQLFAAATVLAIGTVAAGAVGVPGAAIAIVLASALATGMMALSLAKYLSTLTSVVRPLAGLSKTMVQRLETQKHCDLCGNPGALYGRQRRYDLLSCASCGLLWTNPLKSVLPLTITNSAYFGEEVYLSNSGAQKIRFKSQLRVFLRKLGPADLKTLRALEVGSGLGIFLDACKEIGLAAEGCDICERAVCFANRTEQRVRLGTLDHHYPDNSFDAIFAFNLIEHLPHPGEFLTEAERILKPGGTLVLETPIQDGLFHRLARAGQILTGGRLNFFGMEPGGHIYKFSKKTFRNENRFSRVHQRNVHSPFGEIWGNSALLNLDYKFIYRLALPLVWMLARITRQENRLFVMLRKTPERVQGISQISAA